MPFIPELKAFWSTKLVLNAVWALERTRQWFSAPVRVELLGSGRFGCYIHNHWCLPDALLVRRAQRKDLLPLWRSLDYWFLEHAHPLFWGVGRLFFISGVPVGHISNDLGRLRTDLRPVITAEAAECLGEKRLGKKLKKNHNQ